MKEESIMGTITIELNEAGITIIRATVRSAAEQSRAMRFLDRISPQVEKLNHAAKQGSKSK
jgi:hypothetical protein